MLRRAFVKMAASLDEHLAFEDAFLVPTIREADAWGAIRVERMREEHEAQRVMIDQINSLSGIGTRAELVESTQALCEELYEDMRRKEIEFLQPDLLRDDVVTIGQFVG